MLCLLYNAVIPLGDGFDELAHYIHIDWIAQNRQLPDIRMTQPSYESQQAPAYHIAAAALIAWVDRGDWPALYRTQAVKTGNLATLAYLRDGTEWAWTGTLLAARLARLLSTAMGMLVLWFTFDLVSNLRWPAQLARFQHVLPTLSVAVLAFTPKFLRMSATINNDIGVAVAGAACLWMAAKLLGRPQPGRGQMFVFGLALGLGIASKQDGFALGLPGLYTMGIVLWGLFTRRAHPGHNRWAADGLILAACSLAGFAVFGGSFLAYNALRYQDPLGWSTATALVHDGSRRALTLTPAEFMNWLPYTLATYWGGQGYEFDLPVWANTGYFALLGVLSLGIARVGWKVLRNLRAWLGGPLLTQLGLLAVAILAGILINIYWTANFIYPNLRYLSPVYPAFALLTAAAYLGLMPARARAAGTGVIMLASIAISIYVALWVVLPISRPIERANASEVQGIPVDGATTFDNGIELLRADLAQPRIDPGSPIELTIFWRVTREITGSYFLVLDARDEQGQWLGRFSTVDTHARQYAPQVWPVNAVLKQSYSIPVTSTRQVFASVTAGWYEATPPNRSSVVNTGGVAANIAKVKVRGPRPAELAPRMALDAQFDGRLRLEGYDLNGDTLRLFWRATKLTPASATVFVHGLDAAGALIVQHDLPLQPEPIYWDVGEQVIMSVDIEGLGAAERVRIGLYDPASGKRWQATTIHGDQLPDDTLVTPITK